MTALQEEAQAGREKLMAEMLDKGSLEVTTPLQRQTQQGQAIEAREATLWAVEAPTGEHHAALIVVAGVAEHSPAIHIPPSPCPADPWPGVHFNQRLPF